MSYWGVTRENSDCVCIADRDGMRMFKRTDIAEEHNTRGININCYHSLSAILWITHSAATNVGLRYCTTGRKVAGSILDAVIGIFRWCNPSWQEDEEEDVKNYWMTLRTGEDILIWRRRLWIALCGGIVLEEALDLSSDRILNEWMNVILQAALRPWGRLSL